MRAIVFGVQFCRVTTHHTAVIFYTIIHSEQWPRKYLFGNSAVSSSHRPVQGRNTWCSPISRYAVFTRALSTLCITASWLSLKTTMESSLSTSFPLAKILAVRRKILREAEVREVVNDALFDNVETGIRNERFWDFNPFWCLVVFK